MFREAYKPLEEELHVQIRFAEGRAKLQMRCGSRIRNGGNSWIHRTPALQQISWDRAYVYNRESIVTGSGNCTCIP